MTATIAKTGKTKNTQPGPYEGWTVEEIVDRLRALVRRLIEIDAEGNRLPPT